MTDQDATSTAAGTQAATPADLPPEELERRSEAARKRSAAFGNITALLVKTPPYRDLKISDLLWLAGPAVSTGQFAIAEAHERASGAVLPIGLVIWARVSEAVDAKLRDTTDEILELDAEDWQSGDIPWIITTVGDRRVVGQLLNNLMTSEFQGHEPRVRARDKDGNLVAGHLRLKDDEAEATPA